MNILYYREPDMRLPMLLDDDYDNDDFVNIKRDNQLLKEKKIDLFFTPAHDIMAKYIKISIGAE
jgi:hypothetical protein